MKTVLSWLLPIFSGAFDASSRIVVKKSTTNKFLLGGFGFLSAVPYYLIWLSIGGSPEHLGSQFWPSLVVIVPIGVIASFLTIEAHRISPFTLTAPYLSLTPAFLLITSPLMGGGTPSMAGIVGIITLTVGIYVLNCSSEHVGVMAPITRLARDRGSMCMIVVAFLSSITLNLDYIGMKNSNAGLWMTANHGLLGITNLVIGLLLWRKIKRSGGEKIKKSLPIFVAYGFFMAMQTILHMTAFQMIPSVPYVVSAKRVGAIVFTIFSGLVLAYLARSRDEHRNESKDLIYRLCGTAVMLSGMVVVIVWGK